MDDKHFNPLALEVPGNLFVPVFLWLVVFGVLGSVAALVAPPRRQLEFFLLTLFCLGPLGVGFAAIAPARLPKREGMSEFGCGVCGVSQNVSDDAKTAECWQCGNSFW